MDSFCEQILVKKKTPLDFTMYVAMIVTSILAIFAMILLFLLGIGGAFSNLFLLVAVGIGFFAYRTLSNMNIEFEYAVTNGHVDIDRIIAKRKRKRIISTDCGKFEEFGVYDAETAEKLKSKKFDSVIRPANLSDGGLYFAIFPHKTRGRVLLVLEPNERILEAIKTTLPRQVYINAFGRNRSH